MEEILAVDADGASVQDRVFGCKQAETPVGGDVTDRVAGVQEVGEGGHGGSGGAAPRTRRMNSTRAPICCSRGTTSCTVAWTCWSRMTRSPSSMREGSAEKDASVVLGVTRTEPPVISPNLSSSSA